MIDRYSIKQIRPLNVTKTKQDYNSRIGRLNVIIAEGVKNNICLKHLKTKRNSFFITIYKVATKITFSSFVKYFYESKISPEHSIIFDKNRHSIIQN